MDIGDPMFGGSGIMNVVHSLNLFSDGGASDTAAFFNPLGGVPFFEMFIGASLSGQTLTLNTTGLQSSITPSSAPSAFSSGVYGILAGPADGGTGYAAWNVTNEGNKNEILSLSENGAGSATSVTLSNTSGGSGGIALYGDENPGSWTALGTLNAAGLVGQTFISGQEIGTFGFLNNTTGESGGTFSATLGGHGNNFIDMTAWTGSAANLTLDGGGGTGTEVDFNNGLLTTITAYSGFGGFAIVGDASLDIHGVVTWNLFGTATELLLRGPDGSPDGAQTGDVTIMNAVNSQLVDFQNLDFGGHNWEIDAAAVSGGGDLTLNFGAISNSDGSFAATGYDQVDISGGEFGASFHEFFGASLFVESNVGDPAPTVAIDAGGMMIGADAIDLNPSPATTVGFDTVTVVGGNIHTPLAGTINITTNGNVFLGVTNALSITDTGTGVLEMRGPDDAVLYKGHGDTVTVAGAGSWLQGTMGQVTTDPSGNWSGPTASDSLAASGGNSSLFGDGGSDTINLGGGSNDVYFGTFLTGHLITDIHGQTVTDTGDMGYNGFWGIGNKTAATSISSLLGANSSFGTSASQSTIDGFVMSGITHDTVNINAWAWAGGTAGVGDLVDSTGVVVGAGAATMTTVSPNGNVSAAGFNLVLYDFDGGVANAAELAADLNSAGGAVTFTDAIGAKSHMLFAYLSSTTHDVVIADVDFITGVGAGGSTAGTKIAVSDLVDIHGSGVTLAGLAANTADINFLHILG